MVPRMALQFKSLEDLRDWLENRPDGWARAIGLRMALRALLLAIDPINWKNRSVDWIFACAMFRAVALSNAAAKFAASDLVDASTGLAAAGAQKAADDLNSHLNNAANSAAYTVARVASFASGALADSSDAEAAREGIEHANASADAGAVAASDTAYAANVAAKDPGTVWDAAANDCEALEYFEGPAKLEASTFSL